MKKKTTKKVMNFRLDPEQIRKLMFDLGFETEVEVIKEGLKLLEEKQKQTIMAGLANICKLYGSIIVKSDGKTIEWVYDYVNERPRIKSEMTEEELKASERARFKRL